MAIRFKCDCGKALKVADDLAGKQGKCPGCGSLITVPYATAVEVVPEPAVSPQIERPPPPLPHPPADFGSPFDRLQAAKPRPLGTAKGKLTSVDVTKKGGTFCFQAVDAEIVAEELHTFFKRRGYKLEAGTKLNGTYGTGNPVLRVLLGALVKRYKFKIQIRPQGQSVWLDVTKAMSGAWGGLLGVMAMSKETKTIAEAIRTHFGG